MNTSSLKTAIALSLPLCFSTVALADVVAPGSSINLYGTTAAANPYLAGTVLEDELISFSLAASQIAGAPLITGTVQQRVVRENDTGTLDFYWRITELNSGSLGYLRLGNFNSAVFDTNYRLDGLGDIGPTSARRFSDALDSYINFGFTDAAGGDSLLAGQSSYFIFLHTDATRYAKTGIADIASTGTYTASSTFATFAPAVPEPETYAMFLAGLGLLGLAKTFRAKNSG